jgi:redox-sensitive bicupin YhaK (pirin superfamily)
MKGMDTVSTPTFAVQRAAERAFFDFGWLKTHHSFSFADYFDPENLNWGTLRVFNDDTVMPGKGFGVHPHRDMEIVTYVLRGQLEHKDSMGHHGVVNPGGVQYMSAGTGVTHSEFNHSSQNDTHFVQMWVLPRSLGEAPAYGQREFEQAERTGRWLTIATGRAGVDAPIALRQDATLRVARLEGGSLVQTVDPERYGFLFVADGMATVNGQSLGTGDAVRFHGIGDIAVAGNAELILWDVVGTDVRLEDA